MQNKRIVYIDYLRVFSCLAVILTHVFTTARTDFISHTLTQDIVSKIIINLLHFSVPIFFMITGYLFLSKKNDYSLVYFFKKYVLKYILAIFTFGFLYSIIEELFNKRFSIYTISNALVNTIQGKSWEHMWYLYTLVGIMIFIPLLKVLLNENKKYLKYVFIILLISSFVYPQIESFFNVKIGFDLIIKSPYLVYVIIGYYLGNSNKKNSFLFCLGIFLSTILIVGSQIISALNKNELFLSKLSIIGNYDSPVILIFSICIFELFKNINKNNIFVSYIANKTYLIYIVHMFWINLIYKYFKYNIYNNLFIKSVIVFFSVFVLSYISSIIIKKIPFFNKIV